jgi:hypothetical protein
VHLEECQHEKNNAPTAAVELSPSFVNKDVISMAHNGSSDIANNSQYNITKEIYVFVVWVIEMKKLKHTLEVVANTRVEDER